jgi:excisionase family DNA binding protein
MRTLESDTRPLLDIPAVARYLGVEECTVRRMIGRGEIPHMTLGDNRRGLIRIRPSSLDRTLSGWEQRG